MLVQKAVRSALLGLVAAAGLSATAAAEDAQQPFKTLVGRGFKVVATSLVPAADSKLDYATFVITLQLDKAVAVCTFNIANWENLNNESLASAKNCDVRSF
jgi:hypothetical protein